MPTRIELRHWRWPVAIAISLMFAISLGLPLLTLVWQSFFRNLAQPFMGSTSPATLDNYHFILSYPIFLDAVKTSVLLAAMAATIVVALTFVMAWIALRAVPRSGWVLDSLAFTPIAIPHVIVGASVLFAYLMLPIPVYNTIWILLIAYVTLYLPYGMRFTSSGLTQIHASSRRWPRSPARACGRFSCASCCRCLLPVLLAAWIYVFVLAVRELARLGLPGRARHPRARHHQPHHVGGGRQLRRGLGARRHPDHSAHHDRRRPALARTARAAAQRGVGREGQRQRRDSA